MKKITKNTFANLIVTGVLFLTFIIFTVTVKTVNTAPIGPEGSVVGLSDINLEVFEALGESSFCYKLTQALGVFAILVGLCFGLLGLYELVKGKSLKAVDVDLYVLAGFYAALGIAYVFFEKVIINYRPVLEDGELAASYPSSHTVLIVGIMLTAVLQMSRRLKDSILRGPVCAVLSLIALAAVLGRLLAGVHWFTDIIGGILLAGALTMLYVTVEGYFRKQ